MKVFLNKNHFTFTARNDCPSFWTFIFQTQSHMFHFYYYFYIFFSVRLLHGHLVFSSPPQRPMTSDFEGFLYQILSITLFSYLNSWERASIFPFQCWVLNKGTTGTIFITSLVWRGLDWGLNPWPSALEDSTLPLGYRGNGIFNKVLPFYCVRLLYQRRGKTDITLYTIILQLQQF